MLLKTLTLINYKNFENKSFDFDSKVNCFVGLNGVGKSNVLDSIYHLSYGKSYFNPIPSQNIRHGEEYFMINGMYSINDSDENIVISLKKGVKKISILLDKDAQDQALYYVSYFMNNGITVTNILPTEKDASEMGFSQINKKLKNTESTEFSDIISQKLSTL